MTKFSNDIDYSSNIPCNPMVSGKWDSTLMKATEFSSPTNHFTVLHIFVVYSRHQYRPNSTDKKESLRKMRTN
jgi:hypothetical protein